MALVTLAWTAHVSFFSEIFLFLGVCRASTVVMLTPLTWSRVCNSSLFSIPTYCTQVFWSRLYVSLSILPLELITIEMYPLLTVWINDFKWIKYVWYRLNNGLQRCPGSLDGKRDSADVIRLNMWGWGIILDYLLEIWSIPNCCHRCPGKREDRWPLLTLKMGHGHYPRNARNVHLEAGKDRQGVRFSSKAFQGPCRTKVLSILTD